MTSVFQVLFGLAGLVCSAALALGVATGEPSVPVPEHLGRGAPQRQDAGDPVGIDAAGEAVEAPEDDWRDQATDSPGGEQRILCRVCRVTAYCDRGATASGTPSGVGQCAAPVDVPFGSRVYVPALGRAFVVTDRTHHRFRHSTVDIFLPSREQCRCFGRQYLECEITLPATQTRRPSIGG
jgi:3D (Asp-Asp-Asp) domain-containing protein